ncbi:hypothetical protein LRR80_05633 [Streptomyces sp. RO-S4]|uniref:hypothetical protein n=1 Tax=Streptomyces sp. RO-S4 TaxID=2902486 RepID=UPI00387ECA1B|nr:hypothetical protein [Streptomyces sp. RO-S4]
MTGRTALFIDFSQTLPDALPPCLALVVGPAFLLLLLVFRSLLLPVSAAPGALVAVFRWGWAADFFGIEQTGPVMTTMPIFMIGVFSGFVAEDEDLVAMTGLASAVLFDAFVVRMAIVPAVHALLGEPSGGCRSGSAGCCPTWTSRASGCGGGCRPVRRRPRRGSRRNTRGTSCTDAVRAVNGRGPARPVEAAPGRRRPCEGLLGRRGDADAGGHERRCTQGRLRAGRGPAEVDGPGSGPPVH